MNQLTPRQVQIAVESRTVDKELLFKISIGQLGCAIGNRLINHTKSRLTIPINARLKQHYTSKLFEVRARLDLPTSEDPAVTRQLESTLPSSYYTAAFDTLLTVYSLFTNLIQLISMVSVLASVLRDQEDGLLLAILTLFHSVFDWMFQLNTRRQSTGRTCVRSLSIL